MNSLTKMSLCFVRHYREVKTVLNRFLLSHMAFRASIILVGLFRRAMDEESIPERIPLRSKSTLITAGTSFRPIYHSWLEQLESRWSIAIVFHLGRKYNTCPNHSLQGGIFKSNSKWLDITILGINPIRAQCLCQLIQLWTFFTPTIGFYQKFSVRTSICFLSLSKISICSCFF